MRRPLRASRFRRFKILFQKPEHDPVHPLAVTEICLSFNAFPHETGALRVTNGTLVEAVALELQSVEAQVVEQVALQLPRRFVGDPAAAEIWMRGQAPEIGDLARDGPT